MKNKSQCRDQVTLSEAEMMALKDKPYVNVKKEGCVDEETDPGYYMHMRVSGEGGCYEGEGMAAKRVRKLLPWLL